MNLDGAKVLVTGASSGIGQALAPQLAARGATVGVVARRGDRLDEVVAACTAAGGGGHRAWVADLGDVARAEEVAREADSALGGLDVLVNNAAIPKRVALAKLTVDELTETMRVNFESPARMFMALLPNWLERRRGLVVNVSSTGGRIPIANESAYNASKYAVAGWSEAAYIDLYGSGVGVKLVLPGPIATEIWDQPGNEPALFEVEKVSAAECAAGIVDAIEDPDGFEYYVPAVFPGGLDVKEMVVGKHQHCDQYLSGMAQFAASMRPADFA